LGSYIFINREEVIAILKEVARNQNDEDINKFVILYGGEVEDRIDLYFWYGKFLRSKCDVKYVTVEWDSEVEGFSSL